MKITHTLILTAIFTFGLFSCENNFNELDKPSNEELAQVLASNSSFNNYVSVAGDIQYNDLQPNYAGRLEEKVDITSEAEAIEYLNSIFIDGKKM
jgi:hypothetical protein